MHKYCIIDVNDVFSCYRCSRRLRSFLAASSCPVLAQAGNSASAKSAMSTPWRSSPWGDLSPTARAEGQPNLHPDAPRHLFFGGQPDATAQHQPEPSAPEPDLEPVEPLEQTEEDQQQHQQQQQQQQQPTGPTGPAALGPATAPAAAAAPAAILHRACRTATAVAAAAGRAAATAARATGPKSARAAAGRATTDSRRPPPRPRLASMPIRTALRLPQAGPT